MPGPGAAVAPNALSFEHPQANAAALLGGIRVAYVLRRSQRNSIGLQVSALGLTVSAPLRARQLDIDHALQAKARWIVAKLSQQRERARQQAQAQPAWHDGARLPCLGGHIVLQLLPGLRGVRGTALTEVAQVLTPQAAVLAGSAPALVLQLGLTAQAEPHEIRDTTATWLQRQALALFRQRVALHAPRLGVAPKRIGLSNARTRWGSASASGAIRFNWRLVHFPLPVIDYVVIHELAHLRHMNHGPDFWALVMQHVPDVAACRHTLRHHTLPRWEAVPDGTADE